MSLSQDYSIIFEFGHRAGRGGNVNHEMYNPLLEHLQNICGHAWHNHILAEKSVMSHLEQLITDLRSLRCGAISRCGSRPPNQDFEFLPSLRYCESLSQTLSFRRPNTPCCRFENLLTSLCPTAISAD